MAGLQKTGLQIAPDDPWPAVDHNAVVDLSVLYCTAFLDEHGDAGDHVGLKFHAAAGYATWGGSSWRLIHGDGISAVNGTSQGLAEIILALPMRSIDSWGVLASDDVDRKAEELLTGKTLDATKIILNPNATEFSFVIVGPHDAL